MKITAVQLTRFCLELRKPRRTPHSRIHVREGYHLSVRAEGGLVGQGEATPLEGWPGCETLATSRIMLERAQAALQGAGAPEDVEQVEAMMSELPLTSAPAARHGVELALLDLAAQRSGDPLCRALAGDSAREELTVNALLDEMDDEALMAQGARQVEQGFRALKVKVGGRPLNHEAHRLYRLRKALGPSVAIRVDANGAWSESQARTHLRGLTPLGIELCEQPVAAAEGAALRRLGRQVPCLLAADESLLVDEVREDLLSEGEGPGVGAVVLKPMVLGGILPALSLARRAHGLGVQAYVTHTLDGPVGRAGAVHLAAAIPQRDLAHGLSVDDLPGEVSAIFTPRRGVVQLPRRPGLGLVG